MPQRYNWICCRLKYFNKVFLKENQTWFCWLHTAFQSPPSEYHVISKLLENWGRGWSNDHDCDRAYLCMFRTHVLPKERSYVYNLTIGAKAQWQNKLIAREVCLTSNKQNDNNLCLYYISLRGRLFNVRLWINNIYLKFECVGFL